MEVVSWVDTYSDNRLTSDEIASIVPKELIERKKGGMKVPRSLAGLALRQYAHFLRLLTTAETNNHIEDEPIDDFLRHHVNLTTFHYCSVENHQVKFAKSPEDVNAIWPNKTYFSKRLSGYEQQAVREYSKIALGWEDFRGDDLLSADAAVYI